MGFTEGFFNQHYREWTIWQAVERKPSEYLLTTGMPSDLLNFFLECDVILDKLQRQKKNKGLPGVGGLIAKLKGEKDG